MTPSLMIYFCPLPIQVNENGLLSFLTEIPAFFNVQFPLDYPLLAALLRRGLSRDRIRLLPVDAGREHLGHGQAEGGPVADVVVIHAAGGLRSHVGECRVL